MIYQSTIDNLSEDELSILFLICQKFFDPINLEAKINYVKMLRVNIILSIIDILKAQALEEKKEIFDSLKKKLTE